MIAATVALAIGPLAVFGGWAVHRVDADASLREKALIALALSDQLQRVADQQHSITEWDDAVIFSQAGHTAWMADNIGVWLNSFYGSEAVFVLDDRDAPIYAMREGYTVELEQFDVVAKALSPYIEGARDQIASGLAPSEVFEQGAASIFGVLSVVSVRPIVPSSEALELLDVPYLHVQIDEIGQAFLDKLGARYMVDNVRLEPAGGSADGVGIDMLSRYGAVLGRIVWDPDLPGRRILSVASPGILASLGVLLIVGGWTFLRFNRSIRRLRASEARARHLAFHDTLTELPNRALFNIRLDRALGEQQRTGGRLALHCIDLDRFKMVNDTLGHPTGDELIRQVAARLKTLVREQDTVARLGGDEFAIVQTDVGSAQDARLLADRILAAIRAPFQLFGDEVFVDSSIGTVLAPDFGSDRSELMRKADIALYEAKGSGKGQQCIFEAAHDAVVRRRQRIEADLREALPDAAGFEVVYQPVFGIDGAHMLGMEALVRWDHPDLGFISPQEVIPLAEERGLAQALGAYVLRAACTVAKTHGLPWVAVNVSTGQFRDPGFVDMVLDLLDELGLSPERLQLEITEGLLIEACDTIRSSLTKLRFAGVCVALDDFGTGYSSLKYLHSFKVDKIKIDKSFVHRLGAGESSDAIVRAMIDLARALDLEVTAEGVESEAQWRKLAALGAPDVQGYLFSRPLAADALAEYLAREATREVKSA